MTTPNMLKYGIVDEKHPDIKQKIYTLYKELFYATTATLATLEQDTSYWDNLFLMNVNRAYLFSLFNGVSAMKLRHIKGCVMLLFNKALLVLQGKHLFRVKNALDVRCFVFVYFRR